LGFNLSDCLIRGGFGLNAGRFSGKELASDNLLFLFAPYYRCLPTREPVIAILKYLKKPLPGLLTEVL
jgi:hypothetical protein